ncbi:MAG: hypothetical protein RL318_1926 [Fibrobacterota bacterium]|jgi:hypothetical protein
MHLVRIAKWVPCLALFLLSGCLYTVQRFNDGTVLPPGVTDVSMGLGKTPIWTATCPDGGWAAETGPDAGICKRYDYSREYDPQTGRYVGPEVSRSPARYESEDIPQLHASWRLGVRKEWGPFTGVELGWNIDVPTEPASLEFWGKFGLPGFVDTNTAHSVSAGWGIGMWADNSWWLEYAISHRFGSVRPWAGSRLLWQATRAEDLGIEVGERIESHKRWIGQVFTGASAEMPVAVILPDWLALEGTWTFPGAGMGLKRSQESSAVPYGHVGLHFGMGWRFAP